VRLVEHIPIRCVQGPGPLITQNWDDWYSATREAGRGNGCINHLFAKSGAAFQIRKIHWLSACSGVTNKGVMAQECVSSCADRHKMTELNVCMSWHRHLCTVLHRRTTRCLQIFFMQTKASFRAVVRCCSLPKYVLKKTIFPHFPCCC